MIGAFQMDTLVATVSATGQAYWVEPAITLRGKWTSLDPVRYEPTSVFVHYRMQPPEEGQPWRLERPETHDGVISLSSHPELEPALGTGSFVGFIHDLHDWSDNTPRMYAEPIALDWQSVVAKIQTEGRDLFETLSPRCVLQKPRRQVD